jgi:hemerythrin superfamily protein
VADAGAGLVDIARGVVTGRATWPRDAVSVLKSQHRQIEDLFELVLGAEDHGARKALLQDIAEALALHTKIEEEIFYPAVRSLGTEAVERVVDEAFEEHHVIDLVLDELPRVNPRGDRFAAKMTVLSELVEHHVKEEETELFKRAQALGRSRLQELGLRLEAAAVRYRAILRAAAGERGP